ncbi:MAG: hypothetical protein S4CHLAM102_03060 [Chlamydiia bacterium]|nr:hypothetical protein [Chlamydiia bacterium]
MNKSELIDAVATKLGVRKKDVRFVVNGALDAVEEAIQNGDTVSLAGHLAIHPGNKEKGRPTHAVVGKKLQPAVRASIKKKSFAKKKVAKRKKK